MNKLGKQQLQFIAIIAMTLDHIAYLFITQGILYYILRGIGRITFPIMCYFIIEGYYHTSNRIKYFMRLLIFALISQIPYNLIIGGNLNVIFNLIIVYLVVIIMNCKTMIELKLLSIVVAISLSVFCDWSIYGVIVMLLFQLGRKYKINSIISMIGLYIISLLIAIFIEKSVTSFVIYSNLGLILSGIFIYLYNSKKNANMHLKYLFYFYYPVHLLILYSIKTL